ncbi:MAG: hypothetical protein AB9903_01780 [Vulcanimicrobiota bacterium]
MVQNTRHLYTDLVWLWPMWGDATVEYAHYCRHITHLIRHHAAQPATTLLALSPLYNLIATLDI